jgi:hypothetical protein
MKWLAILGLLFAGAVHAQNAPTCNPGDYSPTVNYHVGVSGNGSIVGFIWCDNSALLQDWRWAWNPSINPTSACAGNVSSKTVGMALLAVWSACLTSTSFTADEATAISSLVHKWLPHLAVASGGTHTVWNYSACSNLSCTPVSSGERIASGSPCSFPGGIAATQPAPNTYYSVAGQISTTGQVLPAGSYTPCVMVPTPATGWP